MKGFIRWLLRPLARWACERVTYEFGEYESGQMWFEFVDGFGIRWVIARSPDEVRETAWQMIGMADDAEQVAALHSY